MRLSGYVGGPLGGLKAKNGSVALQGHAGSKGRKTEQVSVYKKLESLGGLVLRGAVGAMRTIFTAPLGMLLGLPPLHLEIKGRAANSACNVRSFGR